MLRHEGLQFCLAFRVARAGADSLSEPVCVPSDHFDLSREAKRFERAPPLTLLIPSRNPAGSFSQFPWSPRTRRAWLRSGKSPFQGRCDNAKRESGFVSQNHISGAAVTVQRARLGSFRNSRFWHCCDSATGPIRFVSQIAPIDEKRISPCMD